VSFHATSTIGMPPPHGQRTDGRKSMGITQREKWIWLRYDLRPLTSYLENLFSSSHSHDEYL